MSDRFRYRIVSVVVFLLLPLMTLRPQEKREITGAVTYVAASMAYINAGREAGIAVGDTVQIFRGTNRIGSVIVSAISKRSSSGAITEQIVSIVAGDQAVIRKAVALPAPVTAASGAVKDTAAVKEQTPGSSVIRNRSTSASDENVVSGRVSVQYIGALTEDSRLNMSQPGVALRLNIQNLYNTGLVLSMYGRTTYDMSDIFLRYGNTARTRNRLYDLSLQTGDPASAFGFGIGRMSSEYVGGMGTFDGGQFVYRMGDFAAGFLAGARVQDKWIGVDAEETKGSFFLNAKFGPDVLHQYSGTVAYGRQLVQGNLDREFVYLQNMLTLGSELSFYESSELELNDINNGVRSRSLTLSNTFVTVNYYPMDWLSTNVGYDGSRSVYLFESMKSFSDTLLDKHLMNGYRAGATVRLPYFMSFTANMSYRTKVGDARDARTISGMYRVSDILGSETGASLRYADIVGVYSNGTNITLDVDRTFFERLSAAFRYDYFKYTMLALKQTYTTHTITLNSSYRFSRSLYASLATDGIIDNTMNSLRVYAEIGFRF